MASLSAQLIVPSRPRRMTRIQTWISHVHPTAIIHQRGTLLWVCYFGVLHTLRRTQVLVTGSEATVERWIGAARTTRGSRRSWPAEDRAQPAEDLSRRTGGGSGPTTSVRSTGGALTYRMTAETLRVQVDIACVTYTYTCTVTVRRYDRAEVVLTLFRSIRFPSYAVESKIQTENKRIGNVCCRIQL
jgi:hypothetical protein